MRHLIIFTSLKIKLRSEFRSQKWVKRSKRKVPTLSAVVECLQRYSKLIFAGVAYGELAESLCDYYIEKHLNPHLQSTYLMNDSAPLYIKMAGKNKIRRQI